MNVQLLRFTIARLCRNPPFPASLLHSSPLACKFSSSCWFSQVSLPSFDYSESGFKRPDTIQWRTGIGNRICLIGFVWDSVSKKCVDGGKSLAHTSLKVPKPALQGDMWFTLEFWEELAEIAAAHLKREDHIFVSGSVHVYDFIGRDNLPKAMFKVKVKDLKYVLINNSSYVEAESFEITQSQMFGQRGNQEGLWQDYFNNPSQWWDKRFCKQTPRHPDFKNKMTGDVLWIDSSSTPGWVKARIQEQDKSRETVDLGSLWQAFFANPFEWWDDRDKKENPLHPDFIHKTTKEALWINPSPAWVKSQLAALDTKAQKAMEQRKGVGLFSSKVHVNSRSTFRDEDLEF